MFGSIPCFIREIAPSQKPLTIAYQVAVGVVTKEVDRIVRLDAGLFGCAGPTGYSRAISPSVSALVSIKPPQNILARSVPVVILRGAKIAVYKLFARANVER